MSSADNLLISLEPTSGLIWIQKFETIIMVFLREFFEKVDFEKSKQAKRKHAKYPSMQRGVKYEQVHLHKKLTFLNIVRVPQIIEINR